MLYLKEYMYIFPVDMLAVGIRIRLLIRLKQTIIKMSIEIINSFMLWIRGVMQKKYRVTDSLPTNLTDIVALGG